jgi:hypothetical protein
MPSGGWGYTIGPDTGVTDFAIRENRTTDTKEEAMAKADELLKEAGWKLAEK